MEGADQKGEVVNHRNYSTDFWRPPGLATLTWTCPIDEITQASNSLTETYKIQTIAEQIRRIREFR